MIEPDNDRGATPGRPGLKVWRVMLGFVLAPIVPGFVIVPLLSIATGEGTGLGEIFEVLAGWTMMAAFLTVPATLLLGVPLFFVFRWRGWVGWRAFAWGGAAVGLLAGGFLAAPFLIAGAVLSGTVGALTLWVCAFGDRKAVRLCGAVLGLLLALVLGAAVLRNLVGA